MTPPAIGNPPRTNIHIVTAAVRQPLAAKPPNNVAFAAASSRWNGYGSNSLANRVIRASSSMCEPLVKRRPTWVAE